MTYTMADFQQLAKTNLAETVIQTWREDSLVMEKLPWKPANGLKINYVRTKAMPAPAWLAIGEDLPDKKATFEPVEETIYKMGAKIDIPKEYLIPGSIVDARQAQVEAITHSLALGFNDAFINGKPTNDIDEMVGLWHRLTNDLDSAQSLQAHASGLDVSPDASSLSANQTTLLEKVDELIDAVEGDAPDVLIMNATMRRRLVAALKAAGQLDSTTDAFDRKFNTYGTGGPMIWDIGYKYDQSTAIIGNVETTAGAVSGGASTSIYAVRFGEPYMFGFYLQDMNIEHVGMLENRTFDRTVIDWTPGIGLVHPRSVARLYAVIAA